MACLINLLNNGVDGVNGVYGVDGVFDNLPSWSEGKVVINQWGILKLNVLSAVKKDQIKLFKGKSNKTLKPEHSGSKK